MTIRIIKIGGSLLLRPHLLADLQNWRRRFEDEGDSTIAIIGGGQMIEAVRMWDRLRPGLPATVHWRCVEMLRHSYDCLREAIQDDPSWGRCRSIDTASQWQDYLSSLAGHRPLGRGGCPEFVLLNVPAFYTPISSRRQTVRLPEDWRTTTDSISLWLAHQVSSERGINVQCVLLKSCLISPDWTLASLVEEGVIDPACSLFESFSIDLHVQRLADSAGADREF
ncbi:amino acid kinase family protein [Neorhodopirellula pilleata]|uniref:Amino acid kinase family protein n=1 Tax=Neorhodopirellula pilleata TaxID=2714738 RepID=A0A5C6ABN0_9BACT|nr:protein kinase [Neorhodopirellula pilleata]TWT97424.1 hypothetical protein Pla100_25760 [Neorhodopirellula pilleata]